MRRLRCRVLLVCGQLLCEIVALGQVSDVELFGSTVGAGAEVACHLCDSNAQRLGSIPYNGDHKGGVWEDNRNGSQVFRRSSGIDIITNAIATAVAIAASPRHQQQHRSDITSHPWG